MELNEIFDMFKDKAVPLIDVHVDAQGNLITRYNDRVMPKMGKAAKKQLKAFLQQIIEEL